MEWSARMAALDFHAGLDLNQRTDKVLAYFASRLQAAYDAGYASQAADSLAAMTDSLVAIAATNKGE